jgi:transposase
LRQKTAKNKPGGQPGHPGTTLRLVDEPEAIVCHSPACCARCGTSLDQTPEEVGFQRRQVHDVPPLVKLRVTEHRALRKISPACESTTSGSFPSGLTRAVCSTESTSKRWASTCRSINSFPFLRTRELLFELFGAAPSEGTLASAKAECHAALEPVEKAIKGAIEEADVVHSDEMGVRVGARTHWLHQAGTRSLTFYAHHRKRGREALEEMDILPGFVGRSVHDGFSSYFTYCSCKHALCNAHLLRELSAVEEQDTNHQQWAGRMMELLREIKAAVDQARDAGKLWLEDEKRDAFEARYGGVLAEGFRANPPPAPTGKGGRPKQSEAKNLLDRLDKHRGAVLRFMNDFAGPFDNNLAERDLRMVKVRQKVSGCFRSLEGASWFCRIRGYISTLGKQDAHVLSALQSVFSGKPYMPRLQPE